VVATTDPATLPDLTTWYLLSNLPAPGSSRAAESGLEVADVAEVVRLYSLRSWIEQSYKQVKNSLGWAHYQVRKDLSIRRHWQLVCCAFTFCWWASADLLEADPPPGVVLDEEAVGTTAVEERAGREKKEHRAATPLVAVGAEEGKDVAGAVGAALALLAGILRQGPTQRAKSAA
jgi:hypothetical protein